VGRLCLLNLAIPDISLFHCCICVLVELTQVVPVSVRLSNTYIFRLAIPLDSYVLFICVLLHASLSIKLVGKSYFTKINCGCLFI
jgi:hypothetical protein